MLPVTGGDARHQAFVADSRDLLGKGRQIQPPELVIAAGTGGQNDRRAVGRVPTLDLKALAAWTGQREAWQGETLPLDAVAGMVRAVRFRAVHTATKPPSSKGASEGLVLVPLTPSASSPPSATLSTPKRRPWMVAGTPVRKACHAAMKPPSGIATTSDRRRKSYGS